jgi:hypothetical protein
MGASPMHPPRQRLFAVTITERDVRRRLFNVAAAVSLTCLAASLVLWPISCVTGIALTRATRLDRKVLFRTAELQSSRGVVEVAWTPQSSLDRLGAREHWWRVQWDGTGMDVGLTRQAIRRAPGLARHADQMQHVALISWWLVGGHFRAAAGRVADRSHP